LTAKLDGEVIEAAQDSDKNADYRCDGCRNRMILRRGLIKVPHFAHRSGEACSVDYEPESQYHLQAKLAAKKLFRLSRVEIEPLLRGPNYMARPDLLVDRKYAVEIQISQISLEHFLSKTLFYSRRGLQAIWIFGEG